MSVRPPCAFGNTLRAEFLSTLQRASGTQNVSCHFLEFFAGELTLTDTAGRLVSPRSLRVAQVPQVIVLVSDAMGFGWQTGLIPQWLRRWSDQCPTILVQPLPTHLWARTSLRRLVPRSLSRPASRLPTLVTELDPSALKGVAEFLSGRPQLGSGVTGIDNEPEDFCVLGPGSSFSKPQRPQEFSEQELDELYADFSARANPLTFRLALYLATLQLLPPIMRLTQAALVPGSAPWHLADLFLSGLIRRKERSSAVAREPKSLSEIDDIEYEFLPGIAERLRADGGIARQFEAIDLVSRLIESRTGRGSEFLAYVLADEDNDSAGIPAENLSSDERALAEVSRHHLRQLGGKGSQIGRGNARSIVITIDGPAGAGKTSIARQVAERLGFELLDTGALYRASALAAIRAGIDLENADALVSFVRGLDLQWRDRRVYLDGEEVTEEIRSPTVTSAIRFLANLPQIRDQISRHARRIAEGRKVVTEGKNQGSEIFPDAVCKVYLICSIEERARRRQRQLAQSGRQVSWEEILESQNRRDAENLAVSASMGPIPRDAVIVDTTGMSVDAVTERVLEIFEQRVGRQTSDIGEAVQVPRNPIAREQTDIPEDGNRRTRVASERAETRQVFISYVHEDEALKDQLATIMKAMPRLVVAERPSSNQDGEELRTLLRKTIERSQSAICLVSNHYLSSKFISDVELPLLLELQEKSALSLHWVPLTRCDVSVQPFFKHTQPLIPAEKPLASHASADRDALFTEICRKLALASKPKKIAASRIARHAPQRFVGREAELQRLDQAWRDRQRINVYLLVGLGGIGKTALIAQWIADLKQRGWQGIDQYFDWSFYEEGRSTDRFFAEALRFFGDDDPSVGDPIDRGTRLAKLICQRPVLLILDGIESLQHPSGSPMAGELQDAAMSTLLRFLAATNPGLCVVTSRDWISDLEGSVESVKGSRLSRLSQVDANLMLRRLGVRGTEEEIQEVCDAFSGHPLTLQLLGHYLIDAYDGDVRHWRDIDFREGDRESPRRSMMRVMQRYEVWFANGGREAQVNLAVWRLTGLFDRSASIEIPQRAQGTTGNQWDYRRDCRSRFQSVEPNARIVGVARADYCLERSEYRAFDRCPWAGARVFCSAARGSRTRVTAQCTPSHF